jgi:precorrin-6B methylase 1
MGSGKLMKPGVSSGQLQAAMASCTLAKTSFRAFTIAQAAREIRDSGKKAAAVFSRQRFDDKGILKELTQGLPQNILLAS